MHQAYGANPKNKPIMTNHYNTPTKTDGIDAARLCLWFYLSALFFSVAYVIVTGRFNGDFFGVTASLGAGALGLSVGFALAPYIIGFQIYVRFARTAARPSIHVGNTALGIVFFGLTTWFIYLTFVYGVGIVGKPPYEASEYLTPLIQITNRINPFYLGAFFIVGYRGRTSVIILGIILLISLGIMRAGIGVFIYVFLALAIRNHDNFFVFFKKYFVLIILIILLLPIVIPKLYSLRSELRGQDDIESTFTTTEIITGRFAGRLSSFSNSSFIVQEHEKFRRDSYYLEPIYFQKQMLAPLIGNEIIPRITPERLLINVHGGDLIDASFMTGVPGNLAMSWFISPVVAALNSLTIVVLIFLSFYFSNKLAISYRNEVCFMLLLYPLTSGVSTEFSFLLVTLIFICIIFKIIYFIRPRTYA